MPQDLTGRRFLVTRADTFMGPAIAAALTAQGAEVIAATGSLAQPAAAALAVADAGAIDGLVVNLAIAAPTTPAEAVADDEWDTVFAALVHPLPRLVRAALPAMIERRAGKIVVIGSASALRGIRRASTYSAARGAQLAYVQAVGVEVAKHGIQVNAIAQNFVANESYFPGAGAGRSALPGAPAARGTARAPRQRGGGRGLRRLPLLTSGRLLRRPGLSRLRRLASALTRAAARRRPRPLTPDRSRPMDQRSSLLVHHVELTIEWLRALV